MTDDREWSAVESPERRWDAEHDDGRGSLALAGGIAAAAVGGLAWAAIALLANLEVGWAAWGVGALVGAAMSRITVRRSRGLGLTAAGLALAGLLFGKLAITMGSAGAVSEELLGNQEYLEGAVAWQMYGARELDAPTLEGVDATFEAGDTLSDALWAEMRRQASVRIAAMSDEERQAAARRSADNMVSQMGVVGGIVAQLSLWDLLWSLLAVTTAYGFMARKQAEGNL